MKTIQFPNIHSSLGGVSRVDYTSKTATVYVAGSPLTIPRSALPVKPTQWDAFDVADGQRKGGWSAAVIDMRTGEELA